MSDPTYINHPLLQPNLLRKRQYQVNIFVKCTHSNCLVVVPTGLGKTIIALLLSIHQLQKIGGKIIFLAPTRPLIEQHINSYKHLTTIPDENLLLLTGSTAPANREAMYHNPEIKCFFMTPQILQNDLIAGRISLTDVSLMIFDEAHRATGNYAYTFLAKKYTQAISDGKILAMTASPGKNRETIEEVMQNLHLNAVEIRTETDPDVKPYIQEVETIWKNVELPPEMQEVNTTLENLQSEIYQELKNQQILDTADRKKISRKTLLLASQTLDKDISKSRQTNDFPRLLYCKKLLANTIRLSHMSELVEAQGINALKQYLDKNIKELEDGKGGKSLRELFQSVPMQNIILQTDTLIRGQVNHPKVGVLMDTLMEQFTLNPDSRVLVFCHFRDTVQFLEGILKESTLIKAHRFIGQQKKKNSKGLSQKEQLAILTRFKEGEINVLLATSVAEEGLDISECDVVIFYDVVPSEIRAIQRRGRTGRNSKGKVIIFKTLGTREEGYFWAEKHREKQMKRILKEIQRDMNPPAPNSKKTASIKEKDKNQKSITAFFSKNTATAGQKEKPPSKSENSDENLEDKDLKPVEGNSPNTDKKMELQPDSSKNKIKNPTNGKKTAYVIVDSRETASPVTRELSELNARISLQQLPTGDYIISERCGIERKSIPDFTASIKDGRLFDELNRLRKQFTHPILIIEGNLASAFSINRAAILGAISSILLKMQIYLYQTQSAEETAEIIFHLAKKEQESLTKPKFSIRFKKIPKQPRKKMEYIISSLPGINASRAQDLLRHFHTIQSIFQATEQELQNAPNIGPVLAKSIRKYASLDYFMVTEPTAQNAPSSTKKDKELQTKEDHEK